MFHALGRDRWSAGVIQKIELHHGIFPADGAGNFGCFHLGQQAVTVLAFQRSHQALVQAPVAEVCPQFLGKVHGLAGVGLVDQVPGAEIKEHAVGHRAVASADMPIAQVRHHGGQVQQAVKVGAAYMPPPMSTTSATVSWSTRCS